MSDETVKSLIELDARAVEAKRREVAAKLDKARFTPVEGQVAFIKELLKNPAEAQKFAEDPKGYAVSHGMLLHPALVQTVVDQLLFDVALDAEFTQSVGPHVTKDLVDLRSRIESFRVSKLPVASAGELGRAGAAANLMAAAAVVMAVAAVVTLVVTLVRTSRPADLVSLQGLGDQGVRLPGKVTFVDRTGVRDLASLPGVRGTTLKGLR